MVVIQVEDVENDAAPANFCVVSPPMTVGLAATSALSLVHMT